MLEDFRVVFADREFECVDKGFEKNEEIEVVIRQEDIKMVKPENGMIVGKLTTVIFKGVHYEIELEENGRTWLLHNTRNAEVGTELGIEIYPEEIHIMKKVEIEAGEDDEN